MSSYTFEPVGFIRSTLKRREEAPRQGSEGGPDVWLEIEPQFAEALLGIEVGHELIVITWLHEARRDVLKVHPRSDESRPLTGVFSTRSPARPNPLGLHPVTVREINGIRVKIGSIEAFDGTPVVDIKSASDRANG
jgi:tRNA-Thr(GGU) m(6)t(6)A37 methyltransferase TsaA